MAGPKPWDQLDDESPRDFRRFQAYLRLKPADRSSRKLAEVLKGTPDAVGAGTLKGLSAAGQWKKRAEAFDAHVADVGRRAMAAIPVVAEDSPDIAEIAQDAARLGGRVLAELLRRPMDEMSVGDLEKVGGISARMLRALAELGALAGQKQEAEAYEDAALGRDAALRARMEAHIRSRIQLPPPAPAGDEDEAGDEGALVGEVVDLERPALEAAPPPAPAPESVFRHLQGGA